MKALIIGANGFLGSHLIQACKQKGWKISCVYNKNKDRIPPGEELYHISQIQQIKKDYDIVFLIAASIPYGQLNTPSKEMVDTNILLPKAVIDIFLNSYIIFSSSISVYGTHEQVITETSTYNNPNYYGLTKLGGETIVRTHPNHSIIRFSSIYGDGMSKNVFLYKIIQDAKQQKRIVLLGDGSRSQNYIHVEDAVQFLISAAIKKGNYTYLGVDTKSYSNIEIARIIQGKTPCDIIFHGQDSTPSSYYNNSASIEQLDYKYKKDIHSGIQQLL